jgi:hypothetical protein
MVSKEGPFLLQMSKVCMSFAAMAHLAEGLGLIILLTLKENSVICLVGAWIPTVSAVEWKLILPMETVIRNEVFRVVCNNVFYNVNNLKSHGNHVKYESERRKRQ